MTTIWGPVGEDQFANAGGDAPEDSGYEAWTKDELSAELEKRDLPKTGNKPELIERLEEDDAA